MLVIIKETIIDLYNMKRICPKCKIEKNYSEFYKEASTKTGISSYCKICKNKKAKEIMSRSHNKKKANDRASVYRKANSESFKLSVKMASYKKLGIKITKEEYKKLYDIQNGYCAICNKHVSSCTKDLALDHCHITGKVRNFLCDQCNTGLGMFKDDTSVLFKAIDYLYKHRNQAFNINVQNRMDRF